MEKKEVEKLKNKELKRLKGIYKDLPPDKLKLVEGLIEEAARLKARLDYLWNDLQENGEWEYFTQSDKTDPYERERPASRIYTNTNKSYQSIIAQLDKMLDDVQKKPEKSKLERLMDE